MAAKQPEPGYLFRGDDHYRGGAVGRPWGAPADEADIQNAAEHVLRKESRRSSRFSSFTSEVAIARKFTSAQDNRYLRKVSLQRLRALEASGDIRILDADRVYNELVASGDKKLARQAADVRAAMNRNKELLVEGQIPAGLIQPVN